MYWRCKLLLPQVEVRKASSVGKFLALTREHYGMNSEAVDKKATPKSVRLLIREYENPHRQKTAVRSAETIHNLSLKSSAHGERLASPNRLFEFESVRVNLLNRPRFVSSHPLE